MYWGWLNNVTILPSKTAYDCRGTLLTHCCTNYTNCGEPDNWFGYQKPRTGVSYICLISLYSATPPTNNKRDYLKGQLSSTLMAGKSYCLTFYYNAANNIEWATNRFGAYVDNGNVSSNNCCKDMPLTPQAQNNPTVFMTDTMNWVKIQNSFTAIGNENTITLGNFVDSATIQFQSFSSSGTIAPSYNIDDVSLIPVDLVPFAGNDTTITHGDSAYIGRPFEIGLNDDCVWYINNVPTYTIAGLWVKPTATTSYVLEQNICGTVSYDTVKVSVNPVGIEQYTQNQNQIIVWPNPVNKILNVSCNLENIEWNILNILGNIVIHQKTQTKLTSIDISNLNDGVYFIQLRTKEINNTQKVIVQH
jgi:hypothetical protein